MYLNIAEFEFYHLVMFVFYMKKVMLGMSGGVDSSVAALLLKEEGYEVCGVTMKLRPDEYMSESSSGGCCSLDDIDDARRVCYKLGIEHIVLNFTDLFSKKVIDYFVTEYLNGRTPNPCIACNTHLKFDSMLNKAISLDFDYIATGHYSIIEYDNSRCRWLLKKSPSSKDQSYVLYSLTQYQLEHTLMPLAGMEKEKVRKLAEKYKLPVAHKPDSQDICFIENRNYPAFIKKYTGQDMLEGDFVDSCGNVLGRHKGLAYYTVGQRKGLGISFGKPMYVTKIDPRNNTITLGEDKSQYAEDLIAENLNFISIENLAEDIEVMAKIRYQAEPAKAIIMPYSKDNIKVHFAEPQRSITPGQAIVFYDGDIVLGGGTIKSGL